VKGEPNPEALERFRRFRQAVKDSLEVSGEVFVDLETGEVIDPTKIDRITAPASPEIKT
jgi:hypothetical protein